MGGGGHYDLPLPTLKAHSFNRKVWFGLVQSSYELGHMGTNYHQDQENTSKFQQCLSYANSDKMIKNGQNKEELSPRKDFYLQKSMLWPDNVFEISNFLAHLRDNGVCWVQVLC